ncbi:MAG: ATP-binding protein, partial [Gemmatimonadota bacterium]
MNESIRRARLRLTAWYVGVFAVILVLFGGAIYVAVTRQIERVLDEQLLVAATEVERAMRIREQERGLVGVVDALQELRLPGRDWYVVAEDGRSVGPTAPPPLLQPYVARALQGGTEVWARPESESDAAWRVYGRSFELDGRRYAVLTAAGAVELEDRYRGLLTSFLAAGLAALVLVALGGAALARRSLVPVEQSLERMRGFVADASHELRTPAAVLRTRAEVALRRARTVDEYAAIVSTMGEEARRLGHLVDGLLILAAADEERLALRREPVFLDDLLVEASELVRTVASSKGVTLELGQFEEAPVDADPGLVRQLFIILLENAVKYTPSPGTVRAGVVADGERCTVTVQDTGPGIGAEMLPHVFDRYYRAESAGRTEEGSGIGLAIAKTIVDAHDADISLTSEVGRGTTVRVSFRRRLTAILLATLVGAGLALAASPRPARAQERISLERALVLAEESAPELDAAAADSSALAAALSGAEAFPNPLLALGYSRSAPRYHVEAELPLDYPWLRGPRIHSAAARATTGSFDAAVARARLAYVVEVAYGQALGAGALLALSEQATADGAELVRIAEAREAAGDAAALDVSVARMALDNLRSSLIADSLATADALIGLQALVGLPPDGAAIVPSDSLAALREPPDSPEESALRLKSADSTVVAEQASLTFARRARLPAPALRFGFETGDPSGSESGILPTFGISIPIPLF